MYIKIWYFVILLDIVIPLYKKPNIDDLGLTYRGIICADDDTEGWLLY